jgi:FkbM family methyltransferase
LSEERLILKVRQLLKPGMTFIDVGANIGLFSVVAAHCVGPSGRVFAFEPQESLAAPFGENVRLNGLTNVIHVPVALGSTAGASNLFQISGNDGQATLRLRDNERSVGPVARVPVRTLSDVLREHGVVSVDGMKIDVEGGDLDVLEGFRDWLAAAPPRFIMCECLDRLLARFGHRSEDLIRFLQGYGYVVYQPSRAGWAPLAAKAVPVVSDVLALHGAC